MESLKPRLKADQPSVEPPSPSISSAEQTQPERPPPTLKSSPNPKNKLLLPLILAAIGLLAILAIAGIFLYKNFSQPQTTPSQAENQATPSKNPTEETPSPTPDPTSDWETYTNTEYSFEFKYPKTITVEKDVLSGQISIASGEIIIQPLQKLVECVGACPTVIKKEQTTFASKEATYIEAVTANTESLYPSKKFSKYILENNSQYINIIILYEKNLNKKNTFDQILSTFKFLDDESLPYDTTGWRTISRKFWQFKTPPNWNYLECNNETIFVGPQIDKDENPNTWQGPTFICAFDGSPGTIQIARIYKSQKPEFKIPTESTSDLSISNSSNIIIDNKKATIQIETITKGQGQGVRWKAYIQHTPDILDVITLHDAAVKPTTFDPFLSTFKFLDESTATTGIVKKQLDTCGVNIFYPSEDFTKTRMKKPPTNDEVTNLYKWKIKESPSNNRVTVVWQSEGGFDPSLGETPLASLEIDCYPTVPAEKLDEFKDYITTESENINFEKVKKYKKWGTNIYEISYSIDKPNLAYTHILDNYFVGRNDEMFIFVKENTGYIIKKKSGDYWKDETIVESNIQNLKEELESIFDALEFR